MADAVDKIINSEACFVPTEVIAEIVYVLNGVYKVPRAEITDAVLGFLDMKNIQSSDEDSIEIALNSFSGTKLDFVDCMLVGYSDIDENMVFTFDKELKRYLKK